jgi:DNA-binding transcriptional regulator YdaS (Cro superfamily)
MSELRKYLDSGRGRGSDLARALSVTPGAIWQWAEERVPAERVLQVEKATGVSRHDLRPDLYPREDASAA